MAGKTISQLIRLEGAEEIKRLLTDLGQVGSRAFEQIAAATAPATKALEGISNAVAAVEREVQKLAVAGKSFGSALGQLGGAANNFGSAVGTVAARVALFTTAIVAAGAGIVAFSTSAVQAADALAESAAAIGLNVQSYQGLQFAAAKAGVGQEQFATGMAKFSKQITDAASEQSKALLQFAESAGKGLKEAGVFVVQAGRDFAGEFKVIGEAASQLQQQLKSQGIEIPLFRIVEQLKALANGSAEARKQFEALTGQTLPAVNAGLERLRGLSESGGNAIRRLGISTRDATGQIRPTEDVLGDIAEKFKALPEGAQRTALALELFGKAGAKMGSFLSQGREGIQETIKELERLGILLSKDEVAAADKAADALDLLGLSAQNLRLKLGLVFADPIREGAGALTRVLAENSTALQNFARNIAGQVVPVVRDLIRLLSGQEGQIENRWILEARDAVVEFGHAVRDAIFNIIIPAFNALMGVLDSVAKGINDVFGTTLTGGQIGIAIVVAQLLGLFSALAAAVVVVTAGVKVFTTGLALLATVGGVVVRALALIVTALAGLVSWPALIVAGLIAAGIAIVVFWEDIKRGALAAWEYVGQLFAKPFAAAWKWIVDTFDSAIEALKQKAQAAVDFITDLFTKSADKTGASVPQGVPLLGQQPGASPFDRLPQADPSQGGSVIEDRRGESQFGPLADEIEAQATAVLERIQAFAAEVTAQIATVFAGLRDVAVASMQEVIATVQGGADLAGTLLQGAFERAASGIQGVLSGLSSVINEVFAALASAIDQAAAQIDAAISAIIARLEEAVRQVQALAAAAAEAAAAAAAGAGGDTGNGFARGGFTGHGGRLTPAGIVHRGEYVEPAHVVAKPGVLAFLETLRRTGDLGTAIARITRGFDGGGLVAGINRSISALAVPSFALGGMVPAAAALPYLGTVGLDLGGGNVVRVGVDRNAVDALHRAGLHRLQVRASKLVRP